MGHSARQRPERLAEKLLQIRLALKLSQSDLLRKLGLEDDYFYTIISKNELGIREPTLRELLGYARLANVHVEVLIDDELDLPEFIPGAVISNGIKRGKS
jgi:transcriptional regulator with XRE-family HTH domain